MDTYEQYIALSRYSRWLEDENRRETWAETVGRYVTEIAAPVLKDKPLEQDLYRAIYRREVMPSMRAMMTAGPAAHRDNTCVYNCAYLPLESKTAFAELMYILLCGTGVGFSVERQSIASLPEVPVLKNYDNITLQVEDSKEGWADALNTLVYWLYEGCVVNWDLSKVRPAGARLKTFGGRASGPQPLDDLLNFVVETFTKAQGRKLTSLECHDIACKIGDVVVVGGVRRSAMISLSNLSDDRMRHAKSGQWWIDHPYRALANNSAVYTDKPDSETFLREWSSLVESKSGERGIFNRQAALKQVETIGRRDPRFEFGTNPCSEIILRPRQFCNLTEVVVRADDTYESLQKKVKLATILGTVQATYTHFPYLEKLNPDWKVNTEEERLLGVSMTGIMDCKLTSSGPGLPDLLTNLKKTAIAVNKEWSQRFGINQSTAITCVKPSGTVSQLVNSASGIHPRHSQYYIRTVRGDNKDPLTQYMQSVGFPYEPCVNNPENVSVFSFPVASPEGCITRDSLTALDQLELWLTYQKYWCEHKPSITVTVRDDEWIEVANFVYNNFDYMTGVSFLPHSDHVYKQAPYQEINYAQYVELSDRMPRGIDWSGLRDFERYDNTKSSQTFACTGDVCEVVDI